MSKKKQQKTVQNYSQPTPKSTEQATKNTLSVPQDGILNFFNRFGIYIFLIAVVLIANILYKDFLWGRLVFLFKDIGSDTYNFDFPKLYQLADYWQKEGVPAWAFEQGMGQNIHPYWFDPFTFLLILGGKNGVAQNLIFVYILQILTAGLLFYLFLKTRKMTGFVAILGGILYTFCGYIVLGSTWQITVFGTEIVYAAFLLFALEKFITDKQWYYIPLPIAMIAIHVPFYLFLYTILIIIYFTLRFNEENKWSFGKWFIGLSTIGLVSVIGVGIGAFMFGSNLLQMLESPRGSGDFAYTNTLTSQPVLAMADSLQLQTNFLRLFSTNLLGHADAYKGWGNYMEAASLYCGLICLVATPQIFHFANRKQRIIYGILLGLCLLVLFFPYFRYTFWAFTGDYYRTLGLFIVFILLYFTTKSIQQIIEKQQINLWILLSTIIVLLLVLFVFFDGINVTKSLRSSITIFLLTYASILFILSKSNLRNIALILLMTITIGEVIYISTTTVNRRNPATKQEMTEVGMAFNDATVDALKYIKSIDKSPFYRIDKDYASGTAIHASTNDAKVQEYYGTRSYMPFNQLNYIRFLKEMDQIPKNDESFTRWAPGLINNSFLQSSNAVKYMLSKAANSTFLTGKGYDSLATFNDVKVWRNKYALPLAFCYDKYMTQAEAKKLSTVFRTFATLQGGIVENEMKNLQKMQIDTTKAIDFPSYQANSDALKKNALDITKFSENEIIGKINIDTPKLLYFSIPLDGGWLATVDGKEAAIQKVNFGMMGVMLNKGQHEVKLHFTPPYSNIGGMVSMGSILIYGLLMGFFIQKNRKKKVVEEINDAA
jgi:uncharacterized membrane protein YfhO